MTDPTQKLRCWQQTLAPVCCAGRRANEAHATRCLAGYGAGIGFFFRNLAALTQQFRVHAVDLLGTGMSGVCWLTWTAFWKSISRIACHAIWLYCFALFSRPHLRSTPQQLHPTSGRPPFGAKNRADAEAFFLESLAKWRQQMGIDKMVLVGHSLVRQDNGCSV
jgi:abhydrolase domain-containing protein 5